MPCLRSAQLTWARRVNGPTPALDAGIEPVDARQVTSGRPPAEIVVPEVGRRPAQTGTGARHRVLVWSTGSGRTRTTDRAARTVEGLPNVTALSR